MLQGWDNFFTTAASASATLIGLLFVAITLGSGSATQRGVSGSRAFLTPTLVHFGGVMFESLFLLAPWPSALPIGIILGLCGLNGVIYQVNVLVMQRKIDFASLDWFDWTIYSATPALGNASLIAGAAGLIAGRSFAPYAIAASIILLLFAGVYGAWDLTLWISKNRDKI